MLMMGAALVVGLASCEKNTDGGGNIDPEATGSLMVTLNFDKNVSSYATTSKKPTTTWKDNIHDLAIFFVEENGTTIKVARNIPFDANDNLTAQTKTIEGVATGTYDIYVFANWTVSATDRLTWNVNTAAGRNIKDLYLWAWANNDYDNYKHKTNEADSKGYQEAPEIFVAKHTGIKIDADQITDETTNPYNLTRIVSLVRVRINQDEETDFNKNDRISFTDENASLRIRRINTGINLDGETTREVEDPEQSTNFVFFSKGAFLTEEPTTGYSTGDPILDVDNNFTLWKDMILNPAGAETGENIKLDVVLTGIVEGTDYVPVGYPKDEEQEDGSFVKVEYAPVGSQIAWQGSVSYKLVPNGIMELNLTLRGAGSWVDPEDPDKPVPGPTETGDLKISVGLTEWGSIESVDMDM